MICESLAKLPKILSSKEYKPLRTSVTGTLLESRRLFYYAPTLLLASEGICQSRMKRPKGIYLLITFICGLTLVTSGVSGSWLGRGSKPRLNKELLNSEVPRDQNFTLASVQNEFHTARPTVFRKRFSTGSPEATPIRVDQSSQVFSNEEFTTNNLLHRVECLSDDPRSKSGVAVFSHLRKTDGLKLMNQLIVTDVEGGIHALNRETGETLWSIGNLSDASISVTEPTNSNETLIVEPFGDGNIYYFNVFQGLQKLPISIKHLVNASPLDLKTQIVVDENGTAVDDEKIYAGSKHSAVYNIDINTGEILSAYGPGTDSWTRGELTKNCTRNYSKEGSCDDVFVMGKTTYQLCIYSKQGPVYNVTYGAWQHNSADDHLASQYDRSADGIQIAPFGERALLAVDSELKFAKWITPSFPGTINNVFDVVLDEKTDEKILLPHPLSSRPSNRKRSRVFLGQTLEGCWFAMSDLIYPSLVDSSSISTYNYRRSWKLPQNAEDVHALQEAMLGVHDLQSIQFQQVLNQDALPIPKPDTYNSGLLIEGSGSTEENRELIVEEDSSKSLEKYISSEELLALRIQAKEKIERDLYKEHQKSFAYRIANFVYRIVEGGLMLLFSFFVLGILSKLRIIAPLQSLIHRNVLAPSHDLKTGAIEIEEKVEEENSKSDKLDQNHPSTKHVQIMDPHSATQDTSRDEGSSERKKRKRGSRGKKKSKKGEILPNVSESNGSETEAELKHLSVSKKVLGYGSSGTVVFQGSFQHRPVAVKRMLIDFYDVATQEIKLLTESDHHPNVVRYYCSEVTGRFLYIALELCSSTLEDVVQEKRELSGDLGPIGQIDPLDILYQIAQGVAHLHSMKIVHRDLKPQNILVAPTRKYMQHVDRRTGSLRILISDFGLCKRLEPDQSSFHTNQGNASGTSGWRAPELLDGSFSADVENGHSSNSETSTRSSASYVYDPFYQKRLTRAIDIFSMGCVFYYVLSKGSHPFGDKYSRDGNILKEQWCLDDISKTLKDRCSVLEAKDLISQMIANNPSNRPAATKVIHHPLFWPISKKLEFLLKVSDRFEIERRVPPSPLLQKLACQKHW